MRVLDTILTYGLPVYFALWGVLALLGAAPGGDG